MFNDHFCTLGKSLSDKIPKTNKYIFPSELINSNTFYLYPISTSEIIVKNCVMKTSKDLFKIDINLIKNTIDIETFLIFDFASYFPKYTLTLNIHLIGRRWSSSTPCYL